MAERLTETYPCNKCKVEFCSRLCYRMTRWAEIAKEKLAEYETTEEERRSVVFPCKPGQDLFGIYNDAIVEGYADGYLMEKTSIHSDSEHWIWFQDKYSRDFWKVSFNDFGKMVFFTREESEKALKEMKKSNAAN